MTPGDAAGNGLDLVFGIPYHTCPVFEQIEKQYFGKGDTGIAGFVSGLGFGASIAIALVTTFKMKKLKEFKRKVLKIDV